MPRRPVGQPPAYNDTIARKICDRLSAGESLTAICKDPKMPSTSMVFRWLRDERYSKFRDWYTRARDDQAELGFEEIAEICKLVRSGDLDPNAARVEIDAIKWRLGKLRPSKYSDKIQIDQDTNITIEVLNYANRKAIPVSGSATPIDE